MECPICEAEFERPWLVQGPDDESALAACSTQCIREALGQTEKAAILDDVHQGIDEAVREGLMEESGFSEDGEPTYRITEKGRKHVEEMLGIREAEQQGD